MHAMGRVSFKCEKCYNYMIKCGCSSAVLADKSNLDTSKSFEIIRSETQVRLISSICFLLLKNAINFFDVNLPSMSRVQHRIDIREAIENTVIDILYEVSVNWCQSCCFLCKLWVEIVEGAF